MIPSPRYVFHLPRPVRGTLALLALLALVLALPGTPTHAAEEPTVAFAATPQAVDQGATITYTLTLRNDGQWRDNVVLTLMAPTAIADPRATASCGNIAHRTVHSQKGDLLVFEIGLWGVAAHRTVVCTLIGPARVAGTFTAQAWARDGRSGAPWRSPTYRQAMQVSAPCTRTRCASMAP